jgi:hypothetical protein
MNTQSKFHMQKENGSIYFYFNEQYTALREGKTNPKCLKNPELEWYNFFVIEFFFHSSCNAVHLI